MTIALKSHFGYAADALAAATAPAIPFVPEHQDLGSWTMVGWARSGLTAIATPGADGRLSATARVSIRNASGATRNIDRAFSLYGPADVIGIDATQIIRREPPPGAVVTYAGMLAHVEFDRPELPWAYSPDSAQPERAFVRPWIALVVMPAAVAQMLESEEGRPPRLIVQTSELPDLADCAAWAHAQVMGTKDAGPKVDDRLTGGYGPQNLSRLLCPRHLTDNQTYLAAIVPTFATGVAAGLGTEMPSDRFALAWSAGQGQVQLPAYDHWVFALGETADFEALARRLKPKVAPAGVGRRPIDVRAPGRIPTDAGAPVYWLDCALHSPQPSPGKAVWPATRVETLRSVVKGEAAGSLPHVSPRLYAQYQRGAASLVSAPAQDWFAELNLTPSGRIAAGVGTRVVQHDQEQMMRHAWAQLGAVEAANRTLAAIQFGSVVGARIVDRTIARLDLATLAQVTGPMLPKVLVEPGLTVAGDIAMSTLPMAAISAAFRRISAPSARAARVVRRLAPDTTAPFRQLAGGASLADFRRAPAVLDGITGLAPTTVAGLDAQLRDAARVPVATPVVDRLRAGGLNPSTDFETTNGERRAKRLLDMLDASRSPAVSEVLGTAIASFATDAPEPIAQRLDTRLIALAAALPGERVVSPVVFRRPGGRAYAPIGGGVVARGLASPQGLRPRLDAQATRSDFPVASRRGFERIPFGGRGNDTSASRLDEVGQARADARARFGHVVVHDRQTARTGDATALIASIRDYVRQPVVPASVARVAPKVTHAGLLRALDPIALARSYAKARVRLPGRVAGALDTRVAPVMAAPKFEIEMFRALLAYDPDWFAPGLGQFDGTDIVSLLVSNAQFIEAFMAGLSDEFGRELMWRNFPTDRRGTYFSGFWTSKEELRGGIATWGASTLGTHFSPGGGAAAADGQDRVVLLIRGELVRRLPHALICSARGHGQPNSVTFEAPSATGEGAVLFRTLLDAQSLLVGFDLTVEQIKAAHFANNPADPPWWFLIADHPFAPRFGLDAANKTNLLTGTDDVDWADLPMDAPRRFLRGTTSGPLSWGTNSARNAAMLLQKPARAAFNAWDLIGSIKGGA